MTIKSQETFLTFVGDNAGPNEAKILKVEKCSSRSGSCAKVAPEGLEIKWEPYQDAAYYKLSVFADTASGAEAPYDYIGRRVDDVSIVLDKPLKPGAYNIKVEAYNSNERKLAQNSNDLKFTVK